MRVTRRRLLAATGALAGTAGCLSGGSNVRYPESTSSTPAGSGNTADGGPTGSAGATGDERPVRDETGTPAGEDAGPAGRAVPNPELATGTRRIYREVAWFSRLYEHAIDTFVRATRRAASTVASVRASMSPGLTEEGLARLRAAARETQATTDRWLGDHFAVDGQLADRVDYHLSVVEKFRARNDHDRVAEELTRLEEFYRGLGHDPYVRASMPSHPVQNRLFHWLRGGRGREAAFALRYPAGRFAAYAYGGPQRDLLADPVAGRTRRYLDGVFAPFAVEASTDRLYVVAYALEEVEDDGDGADEDEAFPPVPTRISRRPSQPILVERFPDASTAGETLGRLLGDDGPLTEESRYAFGRDEWRRVYWRYDGDVTYALLVQAGEFLVATAPSEVAWEERVDWRTPLERTYLYREPPEGE